MGAIEGPPEVAEVAVPLMMVPPRAEVLLGLPEVLEGSDIYAEKDISKINSFFSVLAEFIINSVDYKFK